MGRSRKLGKDFGTQILLRASEIIQKTEEEIATEEAVGRAIFDYFQGDPEKMAAALASNLSASMKELKKSTYELPEEQQGKLFDIPRSIVVDDAEHGELWVPREHANLGQVRQWAGDGHRYHSVQTLRFARTIEQLDTLEDLDATTPWLSARQTLGERKAAQIE